MKEAYAFWANMYGPSFQMPQKITKKDGHAYWWHKDGNHSASKLGLSKEDGWVCYAHEDRNRVVDFARGFNEARRLLRGFCGSE